MNAGGVPRRRAKPIEGIQPGKPAANHHAKPRCVIARRNSLSAAVWRNEAIQARQSSPSSTAITHPRDGIGFVAGQASV